MDITPEMREHAKTCKVCRAQVMLIEAAKAAQAAKATIAKAELDMKRHCPMCGEQWNEDVCASCGWYEGKQPRWSGLDAIADTVLRYRPKARSEPARQRKRRRTILEKKRAAEKEK